MSKKNRVFLMMLVIINICYLGLVGITKILDKQTSNLPVITFKNEMITISVKDDLKVLLNGVKAMDEEDGDMSKIDIPNLRIIEYEI